MNTRKGFSLVEVVLVLAIAGLIFAATFIALPNLWASQRDAERKEDVMTFVTTLANYQTNNNRGALPGAGSSTGSTSTNDQKTIDTRGFLEIKSEDLEKDTYRQAAHERSWAGFYRDYIPESFTDPEGHLYGMYIVTCTATKQGEKCTDGKFSDLDGETNVNEGGDSWIKDDGEILYIAISATCDGNTAVKSLNNRKVAVVIKTERAGQFCYNS